MTDFRITPADAIAVLNRVHAADPHVMAKLIEQRVLCNRAVADDPTVQVGAPPGKPDGPFEIGLLGILNGIFGADERTGYGPISAFWDANHDTLLGFIPTDFSAVSDRPSDG